MKIILGGARGSFPVSRPDKTRYGGQTFSLLIEGGDGTQILVDAGTGLTNLKPYWRAGGTVCFTHTHLDHILALPFLMDAWALVFFTTDPGPGQGRGEVVGAA